MRSCSRPGAGCSRQAEHRPVVMVIEDAARRSALLDFVEYLVNAAYDRSMLIVTLARPELRAAPAWGAGLRNFSSLHLARLTGGEITQLLAVLAPGLTKAVVARVARRADGVPLYAVEIARMLEGGSGWRAASSDDVLPTSLHALIAARIDGLGDVERSLLMSAAVLGRRFTTAAPARSPRPIRRRAAGPSRSCFARGDADPDRDAHGSDLQLAPGAAGPRRGLPDPCPCRATAPAPARSGLPREPERREPVEVVGDHPLQGLPGRSRPSPGGRDRRSRPAGPGALLGPGRCTRRIAPWST